MRRCAALDLVVVVDVAFTETAREADYVLPAASQFEKPECTFFTLEFPKNAFHLRRPILPPLDGTLTEPEIHSRLCRALGAVTDDMLAPLHAAAAEGLDSFAGAMIDLVVSRPEAGGLLSVILTETLGATFPKGEAAAGALWGLAQRCFLAYPDSVQRAGFADGNALFKGIMSHPNGVIFTIDPYEETWRRIAYPDGRIDLAIAELLPELRGLATEDEVVDDEHPFVLSAGERRTSTANTIFRSPDWRKTDTNGALRMSPADAERLGVADGGRVRVATARGSAEAVVEVTDTMQSGHVSLPNGFGLSATPEGPTIGTPPNELTSSASRDWLAGTPHHKHVRARIEPVG